jgi:hypothetical protein
MRRMLALGVDVLMTDRADVIRDLLRAESLKPPSHADLARPIVGRTKRNCFVSSV